MAGIGFELRRLAQRNDLSGIVQGYFHSAVATGGPWLFTILALSAIELLGARTGSPGELTLFRLVTIYNFAFSLVLAGPVAIVVTRNLANAIHERDVANAAAMMVGALVTAWLVQVALAAPFYLLYVRLDAVARVAALFNFFLISGIWVTSVYLTALKNYQAVSWTFAVGMLLAVAGSILLAPFWPVAGLLAGFDLGLFYILFALVARVFAEYPAGATRPFRMLPSFRRYWDLAAGSLAYNLGLWCDKWIMWLSPAREAASSGMVSCPDYDSAMFLAYLTLVPSLAAFTMTIETRFYEKHLRFYGDIAAHVPYSRIEGNRRALAESLLEGARGYLVLQGSISLAVILLAPSLFDRLRIGFGQLGIFRLAVLGAFFQGGFLFLLIVLSYFDLRRSMLALQVLFLAANAIFTVVALRWGFPFYGYGYFLASLVAFAAAFLATAGALRNLPYLTFVRNNASVRGE